MHARTALALFLAAMVLTVSAHAEEGSTISTICLDAETGYVLSEANADLPRPPASMVKMMLMYMVAEGLRDGTWSLETPMRASALAESMGGSQVYLEEGDVHPLGKMMQAVAVASANDAAYAVAENLWGSVEDYLAAMNLRAKQLGMLDSQFHSVHGLPPDDDEEFDRTTARDMAILARLCVREPIIMEWVRCKELTFKPGAVKHNTNKLLWRMAGCDGLKTGYIRAAGFCITATAERDGIRLIAIVMGHDTKYGRFNLAQELMEQSFSELLRFRYMVKGQPINASVPVINSPAAEAQLVAAQDIWVTVRRQDRTRLQLVAHQPEILRAPIKEGTALGEAAVQLDGYTLASAPLAAPFDLEEAGWRWKLERSALRTY
jgi:D-alanyl-D-alanine carboxypeptidase (penicillin-binding protein 5/6)